MIHFASYSVIILGVLFLAIFMTWTAITNKDPKIFMIPCICLLLLIAFGANCYEHKVSIDSNVKCQCIFCETEKPNHNQIIVQNNENVEIYVDDDSKVTIIEDNKWTCCNKEIKSNFCPDCGKQKITE